LTFGLVAGAFGSVESDMTEGDAFLRAKDYPKAIARYESALRQNANLASAHRGIALSAWQSGDLTTALDRYVKAIELEPDTALFHAEYGGVLSDATLHPRAIEQMRIATTLAPDNQEFWRRYADILWRGEVYPDAIAAYERAIQLDPSLPEPYVGLGDTYLRLARFDEAIRAYDDAIQRDPNARAAFVGKGTAQVKKGLLDEGIKTLATALQLDSEYAPVYYELGIALMQKGDFETAIKAFAGAAKRNPRDPGPFANMSRCYARLGDRERSRMTKEHADRLQKIHDDLLVAEAFVHANPTKAEGYAYLASIHEQAGDDESAKRLYLHAVERDPNYPQAYKALGDLALRRRNFPDAETYYKRALALRPYDVETRVTLGLLYMETDRLDLGRETLRLGKDIALKLTAQEPSAENWNLLAYAQFGLRELEDAERSMTKALELDPNNEDFRQRMDTIRAARAAPK
jgi:tetratricopeptide (TPR) repeat protein